MSSQFINLPSSTLTLHINRGVLVGKPIKKIPSWARWCMHLIPRDPAAFWNMLEEMHLPFGLLLLVLKTQKQEYLCECKAKLVYMMSAKPDGITK